MSVAETPVTERTPRSPHQQLALGSFLGALYVLASLWVVFAGLPLLWTEGLRVQDYTNDFLSVALLIVVCLGAAIGLGYIGYLLIRDQHQRGLRAGILFAALMIFIALWVGISIVGQAVDTQFRDQPAIGWAAVALSIAVLLAAAIALFLQPAWQNVLQTVEDQGWFTVVPYKGNQGVRVRRATVLGVLVLGFAGIVTLVQHRSFGRELAQTPNDWEWVIPFTGQEVVVEELLERLRDNRSDGALKEQVAEVLRRRGVKDEAISDAFAADDIAGRSRALLGETVDVRMTFARYVPLMYKVHLMMPLVLGLLLLWTAYRVVNVPTFADFLIATEAEMNKVSWTTRRRLVQDTIVVLVTVFLLAMFLFVIDALWIHLLSMKYIEVLKFNTKEVMQQQQEKAQW